ncbi:MAG: drug/metabolite transporter (DMT)-like permease [Candidatus Aldehydirespiratoraceae bacterium]|jgi:drug/metabolite transporter (DMT)-like permease
MWIFVTLAAATLQILRTARQHELRRVLSVVPAGFVRYAYGFPLALIAAFVTFVLVGEDLPPIPARFWLIIALAGFAQILGTIALLRSFQVRDFAVGTVYAKTEVILVAVVSTVFLGESLPPLGWAAAMVCMAGVAWLAAPDKIAGVLRLAGDKAAGLGVLAGLGFAAAATGIRAASNSLGDGPTWNRALLTLTVMLGIQTLANGSQLAVTDRAGLRAVAINWRAAIPVGILSMSGSACWAVAVTLTSATRVRTLGQIELILAFVISVVWLREKHTRSEYGASALVLAGIIGVVAVG